MGNSTGPRTPRGKARASQNAAKHQIFVRRVLPEEEDVAALLNDGICAELRLNGVMELKIARDLVQNELESCRIEKFTVLEFVKAPLLADYDTHRFDLNCATNFQRPIPKEMEAQPGYRPRLRPKFCAMLLAVLKRRIEKQGLQPKKDLEFLELIYGNEATILGQLIIAYYKTMHEGDISAKVDEKMVNRNNAGHQESILKLLVQEIEGQEALSALDDRRKGIEHASEWTILPPDPILDRIEKYRTANARKRSRLLADLEAIRRLKGT